MLRRAVGLYVLAGVTRRDARAGQGWRYSHVWFVDHRHVDWRTRACRLFRRCQGVQRGEKIGEPGPPGPKGDPGVAGTTLRVVAPQSSTASCQTDEIMISAYCTGTFSAYPLVPLTNGARCGANPNSTTLRVTIVCAKR